VTGPLVYVNYGRPQDYEDLERRGISVRGADRRSRGTATHGVASSRRWRRSMARSDA
jgi:hypothetical protein